MSTPSIPQSGGPSPQKMQRWEASLGGADYRNMPGNLSDLTSSLGIAPYRGQRSALQALRMLYGQGPYRPPSPDILAKIEPVFDALADLADAIRASGGR